MMIRIADSKVMEHETKHVEALRNLAGECTLFLQNNEDFPLKTAGKIAVYGGGVRHTIKGGTGSGDVNVRHFVNVEEGLKNAGFEIANNDWLDAYDAVLEEAKEAHKKYIWKLSEDAGLSPIVVAMGKAMAEPEYEIEINKACDVAIYVLTRNSGEGSDRTAVKGDLELTDTEKRDILKLQSMYDKFMLVLNVGGMVNVAPVKEVKNILLLGQLGSCTGDVLADILLGKTNPSGKLTMTWTDIAEYPSTEGFGEFNDTYYKEGVYVGYRFFDTENKPVLYPFGFGKSYTDFSISESKFMVEGAQICVKAKVQNIGNFSGKEVVQLYVSPAYFELDKPYQNLRGFTKTKLLENGAEQEVTITFSAEDLASYEEKIASYVIEAGDYVLRLGNHSRNTHIVGILRVEEKIVTRTLKNLCVPTDLQEKDIFHCCRKSVTEVDELEKAPVLILKKDVLSNCVANYDLHETMHEKLKELTVDEKIVLCIGQYKKDSESVIGAASSKVAGAAGETTNELMDKGIDTLVMADGPAGLRLNREYKLIGNKAKGVGSPFGEDMAAILSPEMIAEMVGKPSAEEENSPTYYQYCAAIPIGTDLAQTFNEELLEKCGDIIGTEMEMFGIDLWLAPALNIQRNPRCGRNFEYYSEDPLVSGLTAAAITRGVQAHKGCGVTIKHFACNNQETNRYCSNSVVSERALREIYLKGFEICVKNAAPKTIMSSYNLINGEHSCTSKDLLTDILRAEWGYKGFVMTDWYVTGTLMKNPASKYSQASAAGCIKAGNDIIMPGEDNDIADIKKALSDETHPYHITEEELDICANRMLRQILEKNLS